MPIALGQDSSCAILRDHLKKYGVEVELSTELVDLKQDEAGVDVTLTRGGKEEKLRVKYLVGAVGAKGSHLNIPYSADSSLLDRSCTQARRYQLCRRN